LEEFVLTKPVTDREQVKVQESHGDILQVLVHSFGDENLDQRTKRIVGFDLGEEERYSDVEEVAARLLLAAREGQWTCAWFPLQARPPRPSPQ
jgi:hypothetical protein